MRSRKRTWSPVVLLLNGVTVERVEDGDAAADEQMAAVLARSFADTDDRLPGEEACQRVGERLIEHMSRLSHRETPTAGLARTGVLHRVIVGSFCRSFCRNCVRSFGWNFGRYLGWSFDKARPAFISEMVETGARRLELTGLV